MDIHKVRRGDPRISPTAYATASAWARYGFAESARFDTKRGRAMLAALDIGSRLLAPAIPVLAPGADILAERHRAFTAWMESQAPSVALEIGAGLSGRGLHHAALHPDCLWLDLDLPGMVAARRRRLGERVLPANYVLDRGDLLAETFADDVARQVAAHPNTPSAAERAGPAIAMTEGVIEYLTPVAKQRAWAHIATALARCGGGRYLCEVYPLYRFIGRFIDNRPRLLPWAARLAPTLTRHEDEALEGLATAGFRHTRVLDTPSPGGAFCLLEATI